MDLPFDIATFHPGAPASIAADLRPRPKPYPCAAAAGFFAANAWAWAVARDQPTTWLHASVFVSAALWVVRRRGGWRATALLAAYSLIPTLGSVAADAWTPSFRNDALTLAGVGVLPGVFGAALIERWLDARARERAEPPPPMPPPSIGPLFGVAALSAGALAFGSLWLIVLGLPFVLGILVGAFAPSRPFRAALVAVALLFGASLGGFLEMPDLEAVLGCVSAAAVVAALAFPIVALGAACAANLRRKLAARNRGGRFL